LYLPADILQWDFDEGAGPKHPKKMHLPKGLLFPSKRTKYPSYLHLLDEAVEVFLGVENFKTSYGSFNFRKVKITEIIKSIACQYVGYRIL
jgi:hypothetical protein